MRLLDVPYDTLFSIGGRIYYKHDDSDALPIPGKTICIQLSKGDGSSAYIGSHLEMSSDTEVEIIK